MWKIKALTKGLSDRDKETLRFACKELKKYLVKCTDEPVITGETAERDENVILLGVGLSDKLPCVDDSYYDDAVLIDVKKKSGIITGVNPRSVLIAAYRFLTELGYSFVRPGVNGEKYPATLCERDVYVNEKPSYRYRMICIEGSVTYESVEAMIDWLPKVGMNAYYTQFFTPYIFFKRWYAHKGYEFSNPYLKGDELTVDDVDAMTAMLENEVMKRGLLYQKVGHGWTCVPFGMSAFGWEPVDPSSIPEDVEKYLALVDGKRKITTEGNYAYVPMVSQLCYGNPEVRKIMVDYFVDYCKNNPCVDFVCFSFGDNGNNYCECELCRDTRPADYLVLIVNEIVRRLKKEGLKTKIRFGMYMDCLWKPIKYKIEDQDSVVFSLAPSSRSYTHPFPTDSDYVIPEFSLNNNVYPETTEDVISYFKEWRTVATGRCIIFDYYYMWDCYKDLGATDRTRIIRQDIRTYRDMGVDGLCSCQGQRVFCPTSLGMNMIASTLWNRDNDFDAVRDEVLYREYGEDYEKVRDFLQDLSVYSLPEVTRLEKPFEEANIPTYEKGIARIKEFTPVILAHLDSPDNCEAVSWKYLKFHTELSLLLFDAFIKISKGTDPLSLWQPIEEFVNVNEWEMREYFDAFEFKYAYMRLVFPLINKKKTQKPIGT